MEKVIMVMKRIKVRRLDLPKDFLELSFEYSLNDAGQEWNRQFVLQKDDVVKFVIQGLKEMKDAANTAYPHSAIEFAKSEDISRDSAVNAMRKILNTITELKATKDADKYMKLFHACNAMQVELR